jgi:hypothetical protein
MDGLMAAAEQFRRLDYYAVSATVIPVLAVAALIEMQWLGEARRWTRRKTGRTADTYLHRFNSTFYQFIYPLAAVVGEVASLRALYDQQDGHWIRLGTQAGLTASGVMVVTLVIFRYRGGLDTE